MVVVPSLLKMIMNADGDGPQGCSFHEGGFPFPQRFVAFISDGSTF